MDIAIFTRKKVNSKEGEDEKAQLLGTQRVRTGTGGRESG
jgi:hypothetical protein